MIPISTAVAHVLSVVNARAPALPAYWLVESGRLDTALDYTSRLVADCRHRPFPVATTTETE